MKNRRWLDNAFWSDNSDKQSITAILEFDTADNKRTSQVMQVPMNMPNGTPNPDFSDILKTVGADKLEVNTKERLERHQREKERNEQAEREHKKARELESLFNAKLKAFEIQAVKDCKDRVMKSKLRKAKNEMECMAIVTIIIMKSMEEDE